MGSDVVFCACCDAGLAVAVGFVTVLDAVCCDAGLAVAVGFVTVLDAVCCVLGVVTVFALGSDVVFCADCDVGLAVTVGLVVVFDAVGFGVLMPLFFVEGVVLFAVAFGVLVAFMLESLPLTAVFPLSDFDTVLS